MIAGNGEDAPWAVPRPAPQQYPPRPGASHIAQASGIPYFAFSYSLMALVLQFGVSITTAAFGPTWLAVTFFFLLAVWMLYVAGRFSYDYVMERVVGWVSVVGLVDVYFAFLVAFAGVWHAVYLLDATQFTGVPAGANQYRLFVSFLFSSGGLISTVGFGSLTPVGLFAELWGIVGFMTGVWFLTVLFIVRARLNLALAPQMPQVNPTLIQLEGTGQWAHADDFAWLQENHQTADHHHHSQ